ncbi:MAG: zinc ribbon domain-containing protein [Bacteroidota bacterium]
MSKTKEITVKAEVPVIDKLKSLYHLQKIDSKIDEIKILKGELPMEVKDLEDEVAGLKTRVEKFEDEIKEIDTTISDKKNAIKECEASVKKYQKQQSNVKNNREYDALSKEIELQKLEVQLNEKKIKDAQELIKQKTEVFEQSEKLIKLKEKELKAKKSDLEKIIEETDAEEKALQKKANDAQSKIEERLVTAYHRIRKNYKNGLAVVSVSRNSCGGCYHAFPPQLILEIRQHKKIVLCEHCGRILVGENIES